MALPQRETRRWQMTRKPETTRKVQRIGANGREYVQNTMRFHPSLYEALRESAKESGRTMNAEVVLRLQRSFGGGTPVEEQYDAARTQFELGAIPMHGIADDVATIRQLLQQFVERGAA
jgi:hypothetical protein